jgi:hypothetical protein
MSAIEVINKIKAGQLQLSDDDVTTVARSYLALKLHLAREEQKLEPEKDEDTRELMAFNARTFVNEIRNDIAQGNYEAEYRYVIWFLNRYGVSLDSERDLVFKQIAKVFQQAHIELYRNYEQIIQGNLNLVPPEDERFAGLDAEEVVLTPIEDDSSESNNSLFKANTKWNEVSFTITSNEAVTISIDGRFKRYNFAELGFKDGRKGDVPNSLWNVFINGFGRTRGEISWTENPLKQNEINKLKTTVGRIRKALNEFSGLSEDPFYSYRKVKKYKLKFKMIDNRFVSTTPGPSMREQLWEQDSTVSLSSASHEELEQFTQQLLNDDDDD